MKKHLNMKCPLLVSMTIWLALIVLAAPAFADNAVKLRILLITTGDVQKIWDWPISSLSLTKWACHTMC